MKPKRLAAVVVVALGLAGGGLWWAYTDAVRTHRDAPAYTRPAKLIEKWDGPGAPAETPPTAR